MFDAIIFTVFIMLSLMLVYGCFRIPAPDLTEGQGAIFLGFLIAMVLLAILLTRIVMVAT